MTPCRKSEKAVSDVHHFSGQIAVDGRGDVPLHITLARDPGILSATNDRFEAHLVGADEVRVVDDAKAGNETLSTAGFDDLINRHGLDLPKHLDGAFALAMVDREARRATVAADALGLRRLYWCLANGILFFATRTRPLVEAAQGLGDIDVQGLHHYLHYYMLPGTGTIYRGIEKLLPGQALTVADGRVSTTRYRQIAYAQDAEMSPDDWHAAIRQALRGATGRAMAGYAQDRIGTFLSGGLDSSTLTGLASEIAPGIKSFTIRFDEDGYDEGAYARLVADHFGTDHRERYVDPEDVVQAMDDVAAICDEPYGNTSAIAAYYCALEAQRSGVDCLIAGDGGDELFAGNERYVSLFKYDVYGRIPAWLRHAVLDPLLRPAPFGALPLVGKAQRLMRRYYMAMPQRMFAEHRPTTTLGHDRIFTTAFAAAAADNDPLSVAQAVYDAADGADALQRMMAVDLQLTVADNDLVKVNKMCELAGVAVRYPMLDAEVVAVASRIPSSVMVPQSRLRGLFKDAWQDFLPRATIDKPKHGFGLPFYEWAGRVPSLRDKILDTLSDLRQRAILTDAYVDRLQDACRREGDPALRHGAWDAAMLELWLKAHPCRI